MWYVLLLPKLAPIPHKCPPSNFVISVVLGLLYNNPPHCVVTHVKNQGWTLAWRMLELIPFGI